MEKSISNSAYNEQIHALVNKIKSLREQKGYSQLDMAEVCGLLPKTLSEYKRVKLISPFFILPLLPGA